MADALLKRAELMTSIGRLLARAAKLQMQRKASGLALAPTFARLDQAMTALSKKQTSTARRLLAEAKADLALVKPINLRKRTVGRLH